MDLSSVNPNAHADQEELPVGGGRFLRIPTVAKGQAVTAASRKLQRGIEIYEGVTLQLPAAEAAAVAAAVVDPSQLRNDIERKRVSMHRTPSGYTLVSLEARVWTAAVSCDGANGRGRLEVKLSGGTVWPQPEDDDPTPSLRYRTRDIERMRAAVRDHARRIGSPDLRQSVRQHPNGVWNPVFVVPALALEGTEAGGEVGTSAFVHTIEGSTRVVTCQEGLGVGFDESLAYAGATQDLVRRARAGVANRLSVGPTDENVHLAVKVLTLPAHMIIGVLDPEHQVSETSFPQVISEFVESIHEQPRPWNILAQGGVRGERLVVDLVEAEVLTEDHGSDIVGRNEHHERIAHPNVIGGRLLRAASHPNVREVMRAAILEDPRRQHLTRKRYAQTVGPLLLALYSGDRRQKTAAAALTNEFQPDALATPDWQIREDLGIPALLDEALVALQDRPGAWSSASRELVARGMAAITSLGLLLSDQGSAVGERTWLRGSVASVINSLALCAGGAKILAEAIEHIEGRQDLPPLLYNAEGEPEPIDGKEYRLVAQAGANVKLRELAFRDKRPDEGDNEGEDLSPYDRFIKLQRKAVSCCNDLEEVMNQIYDARDESEQVLVDRHGLRQDLMGEMPQRIGAIRDRILRALEDEPEPADESAAESDALEAIESAMGGLERAA
ncbi:MAG TPA: hypothetical protein VK691_08020 [Solirubrobacteraceae bacterium]|jgi:hypothetical protein|nr:hypothetical protein [Solirubrobacteraceae bacterium]